MGIGYLLMGVTMCALTVMLSLKVNTARHILPALSWQINSNNCLSPQDMSPQIPYVNIALIFCVICIYGLGPCESLYSFPTLHITSLSIRTWDLIKRVVLATLSCLNLLAGVSMALPADLFLQAWRPSAYVISGTINWLGMFLIGMLFGYVVVRYPQRMFYTVRFHFISAFVYLQTCKKYSKGSCRGGLIHYFDTN